MNQPDVALSGLSDLLIVVAVNEGANAFIGEDLVEEAIENPAVKNVNTRRSGLDRLHGVGRLAPGCFRN